MDGIEYDFFSDDNDPYWTGYDGISRYLIRSKKIINELNWKLKQKKRNNKLERILK